MTEYLVTACGAVFLSVIVSFIIPQGKLNKSITAVLRLVCIAILIAPITQIFTLSSADYQDYADYDYICAVYSKNQGEALEELLYDNFNAQTECSVTVVYSEGQFMVSGVEVCLLSADDKIADKIYEYLQSEDYINITVYEQANGS